MVSRRTMIRALRKRGKIVYGRIKTTAPGERTSEKWETFVSKSAARKTIAKVNKKFGKQGLRTKIIKFRKSSPYRGR